MIGAETPREFIPGPQLATSLTIPAQLNKTIDTDKSRVGEFVYMNALESVSLGKDVVMPRGAKLSGRVLGGASRNQDKPSWIVIVIERVEWKNYRVPLHAFIVAQIASGHRQSAIVPDDSTVPRTRDNCSSRQPSARGISHDNPGNELAVVMMDHSPQDATVGGSDAVHTTSPPLDDLHVFQDKNGTVFLLSQKSHLKLPSGTMFILRNQPLKAADAAASAPGAPQ